MAGWKQAILALGVFCVSLPAAAQVTPEAQATFFNAQGEEIGKATLTQTTSGVLIVLDVSTLPDGEHGFHVHETGACDAGNGFQSAGGHFAANEQQHGYMAEHGSHVGDMPNQFAAADGRLHAHVLNPNVTLAEGPTSLLDADGSALVIHAAPDDYRSQPSGNAGDRIACAVVEKR